jgi:hypothetical protein
MANQRLMNIHPLCYFDMTEEELQEFLKNKNGN